MAAQLSGSLIIYLLNVKNYFIIIIYRVIEMVMHIVLGIMDYSFVILEMGKNMMKKKMEIKEIVIPAFMTAVMAVLSPISIPIGPVPISLGTFSVCLSATVLGKNLSTLAYLLYLLLGICGLPVFSNYGAGLEKLLGPTGGYLIGMIFLSYLGGLGMELFPKKLVMQYLFFFFGMLLCYILGTAWLQRLMSLSFYKALSVGVLPFIIPDCIKVVLAFWENMHKD